MDMPLSVTGETDAGWCAATPPNETTDDEGNPVFREAGFSAADPRAPRRRVYDDPEVQGLREHLRRHNGMPGLEIVAPQEIERATRIFFRDGFVVVRDLLDADASGDLPRRQRPHPGQDPGDPRRRRPQIRHRDRPPAAPLQLRHRLGVAASCCTSRSGRR